MIYDVEINSAAHYPAADVPGLIVLAEQVGFGAFWKGESNSTDPLVMLSAVASRTTTIKLGTAIYHIYGRSPVTLGIQAATLQDLSGGRLLLGLGVANKSIAGWHGGVFDRPLKRAREYIDIVRKVAAGERVEYEGEIYQTGKRFQLSWKPSYPNVPVYLAGLGPQMTKLVGKISDGHSRARQAYRRSDFRAFPPNNLAASSDFMIGTIRLLRRATISGGVPFSTNAASQPMTS